MRSGVEVGPALRAETFAVFTAQRVGGSNEEPLFPNHRSKVDLLSLRIKRVHVRIVGLLAPDLGEDDVRFVFHVRARLRQAPVAFENHVAFDPAMPIEPAGAGRRQTSRDVNAALRLYVRPLPDRIVGAEIVIDDDGVRLERTKVKGQHPSKIAQPMAHYKSLSHQRLAATQ